MRRVRYQVASSLDGYIAGPNGEYDWIVHDPDIDFKAMFDQYDTLLMGRKTFALTESGPRHEHKMVVVSRTLRQEDHPGVTIVSDRIKESIDELRAQPGKDIWLFGGGELFRTLLELDCVDTVEPAIIPVVLGAGIPLLPGPAIQRRLKLTGHRLYQKTGIVLLQYDVMPEKRKARKR